MLLPDGANLQRQSPESVSNKDVTPTPVSLPESSLLANKLPFITVQGLANLNVENLASTGSTITSSLTLTPLQAVSRELYLLDSQQGSLPALNVKLGQIRPEDAFALLNLVDCYVRREQAVAPDQKANALLVYGLYNAICILEGLGHKERAEVLFEAILPVAQRSRDTQLIAWIHTAIGDTYSKLGFDDRAFEHFNAAYKLIANSTSRLAPNSIPIYNFFLRHSLPDDFLAPPNQDILPSISFWSSQILGVVKHLHDHKQTAAISGTVLAGIDLVATTQQRLESLTRSLNPLGFQDIPNSIQLFEMLVDFAKLSQRPINYPTALVKLAGAHAQHGNIEGCLKFCRSALSALGEQSDHDAQILRDKITVAMEDLKRSKREGADPYGLFADASL